MNSGSHGRARSTAIGSVPGPKATESIYSFSFETMAPCAAGTDSESSPGTRSRSVDLDVIRAAMLEAQICDSECETYGELMQRTLHVQAFRNTGGWSAHTTADGRRYYHHEQHAVTQWNPPAGWCKPCPSL